MPLIKSKSEKAFKHNVSAEVKAGKPVKQAVAIAYSEKRAASSKKAGGQLTTKTRKSLPKSDFGLPGERKYPMPDRAHAANAKARATQAVKAGKLSESSKSKIDAKANKILEKKSSGGSTKKIKNW